MKLFNKQVLFHTRDYHIIFKVLIIFTITLAIFSGCSTRAQHLKSQPLNTTLSIPNERQTNKKFLIYPFEDLRGGEYFALHPSSIIPVINFFHIGGSHKYPEQAGILKSNQSGKSTVTVGSLPTALPYLLAAMMRETRFTPNATPIDQINTKVNLASFDYVINGKLKSTKFTNHINYVPLGFLAMIGIPYVFLTGEIEYEVSLYRGGNMNKPVMVKTYTFSGSRAAGLYYGHSAFFDLFIGGLEERLADTVKDISENIR